MCGRLFIDGCATLAVGQCDRLPFAEEGVVDRVFEGRIHRGTRGHDIEDRLVGTDRSGIGRIVEVGVDPGIDPRADRSERVGVLEAGEMPQLVRGDRGRQADEIGTRGRRLAGTAQEVIDVDPRGIGGDDFQVVLGQ